MASIGSFVLNLFGLRTLTQNFIPVDDEPYLEVDPAYFTVTNDDANQRNVLTFASLPAPTFGAVTVGSITYAPGYDVTGPAPARHTSTDATPYTMATIPVPAGGIVILDVTAVANLGAGNVNAARPGLWRIVVIAWRVGSGAASVGIVGGILGTNFAPFIPAATTSSTGLLGVVASGGNLLLQANGFAVTEAWTSGHAYVTGDGSTTVGQLVTANGNVYLCTTSGTATGSAPSGTGKGLGTGAKWDYVCTGSTVPVQWTMGALRMVTG